LNDVVSNTFDKVSHTRKQTSIVNMAYVCLEISCQPNGEEAYPVPTKIRIARIFSDAVEAAEEFPEDQIIKADTAYSGQDIYYVCWKTDEPLNIDRYLETDNCISNCGMWLPDEQRIFGNVCDLSVELVAPARLADRQRKRVAAQRAADAADARAHGRRANQHDLAYTGDRDGGDVSVHHVGPLGPVTGGGTCGGVASKGSPWRQRW